MLFNPSSRGEALFAFVAALAPSEGESLDLLRHGRVGAVAAAGVAGVGADADPAAGVAGVGADADPRVGAVAAAGVAGVGADADPRVGAVAAARVVGVALSALIICAFQRISSLVRRRLAAGSRLPYSLCLPFLMTGMSVTISLRVSKKTCFSWIQSKRSVRSAAVAASPASIAASNSRKHRSR